MLSLFSYFFSVFWCLKLLCVKDKKYSCSHFWPCVQCNIEKLFHFFFTSVVCVDKPTDLSVCLSSCPSPFIRRKLSTNKTGNFSFFIFCLSFFNEIQLWKEKFKNAKHKKKNYTKKYFKKKLHNLIIPHTNTKLKGTWEESYLQAHVQVQKCIY